MRSFLTYYTVGVKYSTSHNATIYFTYTLIGTASVLHMYHCTSSVNVLYFVSEYSGMECVLHTLYTVPVRHKVCVCVCVCICLSVPALAVLAFASETSCFSFCFGD